MIVYFFINYGYVSEPLDSLMGFEQIVYDTNFLIKNEKKLNFQNFLNNAKVDCLELSNDSFYKKYKIPKGNCDSIKSYSFKYKSIFKPEITIKPSLFNKIIFFERDSFYYIKCFKESSISLKVYVYRNNLNMNENYQIYHFNVQKGYYRFRPPIVPKNLSSLKVSLYLY